MALTRVLLCLCLPLGHAFKIEETLVGGGQGNQTAPALRIMPLGDSITEWDCRLQSYTNKFDKPWSPGDGELYISALGGYRGFLAEQLLTEEVEIDMVGGRWMCGNHEGWGGRTIEFLSTVAGPAVAAHQPDVVLLMAGTNDFYFPAPRGVGDNVTLAAERFKALLDVVYDANPSVRVLVSTVTRINATLCTNYPSAPWHPSPCPETMPAAIEAYNKLLPSLISQYGRGQAFLHDVNAQNFIHTDYWIWGIHFNITGFEKMATAWHQALQQSGVMEGFEARRQ